MLDQNAQNLIDVSMHLTRFDIPHFLIGGTLLGAVRDGKLIESDKDIDLGIYEYSKERFLNTYKALKQLEILGFSVTKFFESVITLDRGYRADIFTVYNNAQYHYLRLGQTEMNFPSECFKQLSNITMYNKTFSIPYNAEKLLAHQYGEDWKIPNYNFKVDNCKNLRICK